MCIITGPIRSVSSTKIFVAPSRSRNRQLVVYSNTVATEGRNMMILPVPNPASVQFEEGTMHYENIFEDAAASFYDPNATLSMNRGPIYESAEAPLPVLNVGSYQASIAMNIGDLQRLDAAVFSITPELIQMLQRSYGARGLGFVCCILKAGGNAYEPIAYTHDREHPGFIFVPTKHYHMEFAPSSFYYAHMNALRADSEYADDWDHVIYSVGTKPSLAHLNGDGTFLPTKRNEMNWGQFPPEYQYGPGARLCRWGKRGRFDNIDLEFATDT